MDDRIKINALMRSLVQRFGCLDAVAAMIGARFGAAPSKATLSKKMAGKLDWTVADLLALEDASGAFPVTAMLNRRRGRDDVVPGCLVTESAAVAREAGEAVSAMLRANQSNCDMDRADALREVGEAIEALRAVQKMLDGGTS